MNRIVHTAALLSLALATASTAGQNPVTTVPLVFIPPFTGLGAGAPSLSGAPPETAAVPETTTDGGVEAASATPEATPEETGNDVVVADTAARITQVVELCRDLPNAAYTVDCVAAGLAEIAATMPDTPDQDAARAAIARAARDLRALAQENRDPALPRATVRRGNTASPRPVVPVVPSPAVAAEAAAIVAQAQTVLLRSAPDPSVAPEYNRISAALDTTRILLRSS